MAIGMYFQPGGGEAGAAGSMPTDAAGPPDLLIVPWLGAHRAPSGNLVLTRKFLEGAERMAEAWPGKVTVGVVVSEQPDTNLDHEEVIPGRWPFEVEERPSDLRQWNRRMRQARLVLLTETLLGGPIDIRGVRLVLVTEYSLQTKLDILRSESLPMLRLARRAAKTALSEWRRRRRSVQAAGVQANGYPTYNIYRRLNRNTMLFFDSRVEHADLIDEAALEQRLAALDDGRPLRLLFSGRLIAMKGVNDLPTIAAELRRLGVRFEMHICGGGDRAEAIAQQVAELGVDDAVTLHGVLDFHEQLLPMVRDGTDLFVCPHPQGDPACTYIETLACGVPIVGYANEAWADMARDSRGGWQTPMRQPATLAAKIAELDADRSQIAQAAKLARQFALAHTFEQTFDRRMDHLLSCAGLERTHAPVHT